MTIEINKRKADELTVLPVQHTRVIELRVRRCPTLNKSAVELTEINWIYHRIPQKRYRDLFCSYFLSSCGPYAVSPWTQLNCTRHVTWTSGKRLLLCEEEGKRSLERNGVEGVQKAFQGWDSPRNVLKDAPLYKGGSGALSRWGVILSPRTWWPVRRMWLQWQRENVMSIISP